MKIHLAVSRPGITKDSTVTGHLCGREHSANDGDNNSTCDQGAVDCALCLKVIADPKHWRHRRYISEKVTV